MSDRIVHFSHRFKKIKEVFDFDAVKPVVYKAVKLSLINFAGIVLLFLTNYLIIRFIGEQAYGNYSIINVWVNLFLVLVIFGFDDLFVAVVPRLQHSSAALLSLLLRSFKLSLFLFVLVATAVIILSRYHYLPFAIGEFRLYFLLQLAVMAYFTLLLAFFRSMNLILTSQLFEKLIRPSLVLLFIFLCYTFNTNLTFERLLLFQIVSVLIPGVVLWKSLTPKVSGEAALESTYKTSLKSNLAFLGISLLYLLSTRLDLLMLSGRATPQDVGYYNIAARMADIVGYPLTAINIVVHTLLSKKYADGKTNTIYLYIIRISIFTFLLTLLIFLFIVFFGKEILGLFGERFEQSFIPLLILSSSQLLYSLALPFNALLMVTNKERFSLLTLAANVIVTFVLAYELVPVYASKGAALSILGGSGIYLLVTFYVIYRLYYQQKYRKR